jgi:hypothetical protein
MLVGMRPKAVTEAGSIFLCHVDRPVLGERFQIPRRADQLMPPVHLDNRQA